MTGMSLDKPFESRHEQPARKPSIRDTAIKLGQEGDVDADVLMRHCGCSRPVALSTLSILAGEGTLVRVSRGVYTAARKVPGYSPRVQMYGGIKAEAARQFTNAEAFLQSREQFPGSTTSLPTSRPPVFRDRGRRR
jgi:hypothetical protein